MDGNAPTGTLPGSRRDVSLSAPIDGIHTGGDEEGEDKSVRALWLVGGGHRFSTLCEANFFLIVHFFQLFQM
jgi:hypothetical protein